MLKQRKGTAVLGRWSGNRDLKEELGQRRQQQPPKLPFRNSSSNLAGASEVSRSTN